MNLIDIIIGWIFVVAAVFFLGLVCIFMLNIVFSNYDKDFSSSSSRGKPPPAPNTRRDPKSLRKTRSRNP